MSLVFAAIVPILLLLALGAILRRWFLTEGAAWDGLSWLSYWIFTPALFITSIGEADLTVVPPGPLLLSLAAPILAVTALTFALGRVTAVLEVEGKDAVIEMVLVHDATGPPAPGFRTDFAARTDSPIDWYSRRGGAGGVNTRAGSQMP